MATKACRKCGAILAIENFYKHPRMRDGHLNTCKPCHQAAGKAHRERPEIKEHRKDVAAAWRAANPDRVKASRARVYEQAKKSGVLAARAQEQRARRQAAKTGPPVSLTAILKRDGLVCHICGKDIADAKDVDFDHVIPISRGGLHAEDNIKVAHASCNRWKSGRLLSELDGTEPPDHDDWQGRVSEQGQRLRSEATRRWWAGDPAAVAARNAKVSAAMKGNQRGLGNRGGLAVKKGDRWAIEHDSCVSCGTTERPHVTHGLCNACRLRARRVSI